MKYQGVVKTVLLDWVFCLDQNKCSSSMRQWRGPGVPNHAQLQFEANYYKHGKPLRRSRGPQTRVAWAKVEIGTCAEADDLDEVNDESTQSLRHMFWRPDRTKSPFCETPHGFSYSEGRPHVAQGKSTSCCVGLLTMQMLMLAQEGGRIKGGRLTSEALLTHFSAGRRAHLRESHLCSSNRPDHWDNYAINTGNEKKVGHATFHRPQHSHILTGLGM